MAAATVVLALLVIGVGILFSAVLKAWVAPAADVLTKGF
jgi:hypothetical protein